MRSHWRLDVLRVQQLYSFAHAVAIVHVLTGRTKEWVATRSANTRTTPLAVTITRVMRVTVVVTQLCVWGGLTTATLRYGPERTWAMLGFGLLSAYVQVPLLFLRTGVKGQVLSRRARLFALLSFRRAAPRLADIIPAPREP